MNAFLSLSLVAVLACCVQGYFYPGSPYDGIRPRSTVAYPTGKPEPRANHNFHHPLFYHASSHYMRSCADHYHPTAKNGYYRIFSATAIKSMMVFCDFTTEPGKIYTLVMSSDSDSRTGITGEKLTKSLLSLDDNTVNVDHPNFNSYRVSNADMKRIAMATSHWRLTCIRLKDMTGLRDMSLQTSVFSRYVRATTASVNILDFSSTGKCENVEYARFQVTAAPGSSSCSNCQVELAQGTEAAGNAIHVNKGAAPAAPCINGDDTTQLGGVDMEQTDCADGFLQLWFGKGI